MNKIDFSYPGGFPLDADVLDFLQSVNNETLARFFSDVPFGSCIAVSGVVVTGTTVSNGLVYYNNELYQFTGGSISGIVLPGQMRAVVFTESTIDAVFEDQVTTHPIYKIRTANLGIVSTGAANAVDFSSLQRWQKYLGDASREDWTPFAFTFAGATTVSAFYKKNLLTNTLQLRGDITVNCSLVSSPPIYMASSISLPVGYRPSNIVPFTCYIRYHGGMIAESVSGQFFNQINAEVRDTGTVTFGVIKSSAPSYTFSFNTLIPLD